MKYFFALIHFFSATCFVNAQLDSNYKGAPFQDTIPVEILSRLKQRLENDKSTINEPKAKANSYKKSLYDDRFEYVVDHFNRDYFITSSPATIQLQKILEAIYNANPGIPREASVYLFRSEAPNAISFGDGTIGVTLGLTELMEEESQIAFVLCHELAHYHAKHADLQISELTRINFDKETEQKVKDIRSSEYGRYTKLKNLYEGLGLSINTHSRGHEFEADSLGLTYYMRTGYSRQVPKRVMEILDSADVCKHPELIDLKRVFNCKDYPFNNAWVNYTKSTRWYASANQFENDSLRTHPSCKRRGVALERQLTGYAGSTTSQQATPEKIDVLKIESEFELIETNYHFKRYGRAFFIALQLESRYPENTYLHAMIARCMYQFYNYQKNHELGKVLEMPDPRFDENYDRVLTFIHNLRLQEIASLAYCYAVNQKEKDFSDEEYLYSFWLCSQLPGSNIDPDKVKDEYSVKFKNGKYAIVMK